jgi:L,D-peptidoglycan transpeptidase YkuD (ErfK/YbiS/YcfS/YnhG family)
MNAPSRTIEVFSDGRLWLDGAAWPCVLGRSGVVEAAAKREGDGATPLGEWPIRRLLYRPDKGLPATALEARPIAPDDGWCDDPGDLAYNRPVALPYPASHERLWRDDGAYDLVVELGYNDDPPVAGLGSAIFLHLAKPGLTPTEGCVAVERPVMEALLGQVRANDVLRISRAK